MELLKEVGENRKPEYKINNLFLNRWSPRAMTGEEIKDEELMSMFEAAKWAPSSFNSQLWRFVYAKRNTKHWDKIFNLLDEFNKTWVKNASALVIVISKKNFDHNNKPSFSYMFDAGAASENFALQAVDLGWCVHAMIGFDFEKTKNNLNVPDDYDVLAMLAVGKKDSTDKLPEELKKKEVPNDRKKLSELIMEGEYKE